MTSSSRRIALPLVCLGLSLSLMAGCTSRRLPAPVEVRDVSVPPSAASSEPSGGFSTGARAPRPAAEAIPLDPSAAGSEAGFADPVTPAGFHRVNPGESLGFVARKYGLSTRDLALWNELADPNRIEVGQLLRLTAPGSTAAPAAAAPPPAAVAVTPPPASTTVVGTGEVRWPAAGEVLGQFGNNGLKGITLAGNEGDPVTAATDGTVIYAGVGPKGYGNLVVIRRADGLLTSYAHNKSIRVKKDQAVKAGDLIADLGQTDAKRPMLYFEVRRKSKPVDPLTLLPAR